MTISSTRRTTGILTIGALTASLLSGAMAVAPSASAAGYPVCTTTATGTWDNGTYSVLPFGSGTTSCSLSQGNTGAGVRALQRDLNDCYGKHLEEDGIFGSLTKAALREVQDRVGASVDGIYGPETRYAMKWAQYSLETGAKVSCHFAS